MTTILTFILNEYCTARRPVFPCKTEWKSTQYIFTVGRLLKA